MYIYIYTYIYILYSDHLVGVGPQPQVAFPEGRRTPVAFRPKVDTSKPLESFNMLGASGVAVLNAAVGEDAAR